MSITRVLHSLATGFPLQTFQTNKPDGESRVQELKRRGQTLFERKELEESRRQEVQQSLTGTEQQWRTVLQMARQAELHTLSDNFDTQSKNTQSWIRDKQHQLQSVGIHTPPEHRSHTAEVCIHNMIHELR